MFGLCDRYHQKLPAKSIIISELASFRARFSTMRAAQTVQAQLREPKYKIPHYMGILRLRKRCLVLASSVHWLACSIATARGKCTRQGTTQLDNSWRCVKERRARVQCTDEADKAELGKWFLNGSILRLDRGRHAGFAFLCGK
ncbi:hypothetical protein QAD02_004277 [Eretmocerus hayati]|uniref:Uncharacterized protein n=1 Tax=Eretmocerus hayati TaxID=131215 RepID=A0ACC2NQX0_9HYME|nr:hypothetical protein QAD02_004277 [Eretmocerus hayati]